MSTEGPQGACRDVSIRRRLQAQDWAMSLKADVKATFRFFTINFMIDKIVIVVVTLSFSF